MSALVMVEGFRLPRAGRMVVDDRPPRLPRRWLHRVVREPSVQFVPQGAFLSGLLDCGGGVRSLLYLPQDADGFLSGLVIGQHVGSPDLVALLLSGSGGELEEVGLGDLADVDPEAAQRGVPDVHPGLTFRQSQRLNLRGA